MEVLRELVARAGALVFRPEGAELPVVARPSSPLLEAAFLAALGTSGEHGAERGVSALGVELQRMLGGAVTGGQEGAFLASVERALGDVAAGLERPGGIDHAGLRELGARLVAELARGIGRDGLPEAAERSARVASAARPEVWVGREGVLLRALVAIDGGPGAAQAEALRAAAFAAFETDERAALQRTLLELGEGSLREALARTLVGVDLEHLLNLARRESGEPLHWSFPVWEGDLPGQRPGEGWTAAHLFVSWRDDRGAKGKGAGGAAGTWRFTVGVDFSFLGPVHAQFVLRPASLSVRVGLERAEVVELLRARSGELVEALAAASGGREVALHVALEEARPVDAASSSGGRAREIQYLRDHHLMDVEG